MGTNSVAVIGLGLIGSIWAGHYKSEGLLAASWNRTPKPNLNLSQAELSACCEKAKFLHLCLYDADSVGEILHRLLPHLTSEHCVIQSSTIDAASAGEFAELVARSGASYLEAPFTGSKPAAEQRKTVFFLGGEASVVELAEPILSQLSARRFHLGEPAQAATIKLAMNLQIASISQALCEALTMARDAGVNDDAFFEVLRENVSWSGLAELKEPKLREADFSPQFSIKNLHKDMRLARATSSERKLPQLERVIECLEKAEEAGYGEDDFISLLRLL